MRVEAPVYERSNMRRLYILLSSVVTATLLIVAANGASAAPPNPPTVYNGVLWVSPSLQKSYWASAYYHDVANRAAYDKCVAAATDCTPGVWVKNGSAAYAVDANGAWGTGWDKDSSRAKGAAQAVCQGFGGVTCDTINEGYRTTRTSPVRATTGGIPGIPPPITAALPPAATGLGVGGPGQDR
jgi:hypothetical protein